MTSLRVEFNHVSFTVHFLIKSTLIIISLQCAMTKFHPDDSDVQVKTPTLKAMDWTDIQGLDPRRPRAKDLIFEAKDITSQP